MWCLISQPNSVVFEVRVDPRAIGQECLEKVCKHVMVRYESDYFGLKYENNKGEELWLNLRNPIDRQVNYHGNMSHIRLALRVKFWVPPHLLQQESTRHQFFLHARLDFLEKRLLAPDWDSISRLIAYAAQAEFGDFSETDPPRDLYATAFSLAPSPSSPPSSACSTPSSSSSSTEICEETHQSSNFLLHQQTNNYPPVDLIHKIVYWHKKCQGMKTSSAEYWFLKEVSEFENFGEETFQLKSVGNAVWGVGPHGITIYDKSKPGVKDSISFTNITSASSHKRTFKLEYLNEDSKESQLNIKLDSNHMASSLYRAITEKHAFYSCETVRSAVTSQFIRDLKGTIVSIFNEDSTLGKKYVFDIRRTCREVYDNVRRAIYQENNNGSGEEDEENSRLRGCADQDGFSRRGSYCKNSQETLARILDAMTCKICMDQQMDAVFLPCGHLVACTQCASKCDRCPLCRSDIQQAQKFFFPVELKNELNNVVSVS